MSYAELKKVCSDDFSKPLNKLFGLTYISTSTARPTTVTNVSGLALLSVGGSAPSNSSTHTQASVTRDGETIYKAPHFTTNPTTSSTREFAVGSTLIPLEKGSTYVFDGSNVALTVSLFSYGGGIS